MTATLKPTPLNAADFAPFGEVLEATGAPDKVINQGMCGRHHDRAALDFADGRAGISVFNAQARSFPVMLDMMERHPDGSQAFIPMHQHPYLVAVAEDADGTPATPRIFIAQAGQGVNYHRNIWHGVLCPLHDPGLFAVVDRIGGGANLQEHWFETAWKIDAP